MKHIFSNIKFIPTTYLLIIAMITSIITSIAIINGYSYAITIFYVLFAFYISKVRKDALWPIIFIMTFVSFTVLNQINNKYNHYLSNKDLLNYPVAISGEILQINRSSLAKEQINILINIKNIYKKGKKLSINKKISIFLMTNNLDSIEEGQRIYISRAILNQPEENSDYEKYLIKESIWATAHCKSENVYPSKRKNSNSYRSSILKKINEGLSKSAITLFNPLFLGQKEKKLDGLELQHKSIYWGIAHHMARSGAHLAILFALIMLILHYTRLSYLLRYFLAISLLLGYTFISYASISFVRALIMILLHLFAKIIGRRPSPIHTLTLTTLIIVIYNPIQIFFLDFQLSFGITSIIIWLFSIKKSKKIDFSKAQFVRS